MANQMIALQARAPQSSGLGGAIAQNAQMINMMRQQEASDRANALAAQKLAQDQALMAPQLAEAKSKAFSAEQKALTDFFDVAAKVIGLSKSPEDVRFGADMLKKRFDNPLFAQMIDQTIKDMPDDPQAFGAWRNQTKLETLDAKDQVPYFFEQVKSKELIGETGDVGVLTTGGLGAPTIRVPKTLVPRERRGTVTVEPSVTVEPGVGGPDETSPARRLMLNLASVRDDADYQTILNALDRADPTIARQLRAVAPRFDRAVLARVVKDANAAIGSGVAPTAGGLVAGERGGVGGPYEAVDDGYVEAATPFRAKNPMQSPMPGSAIVPLPRVASEAGAEEGGRKAAARIEQLKTDLPKAHSQTTSLINNLTDRINRIDKFLRNPYRNTVIGSIEGRIPEFLMNERRADAIADWKFITNNSVLDKLIEDRRSTETGASPQGLVSDRDLSVAASAANSLTRTGSEKAQEAEMKRLRDVLYRTRETALKSYNNTYSNLVKSDPRFRLSPPPVSPKYTGPLTGKRTSSGATVENWD